MTLEIALIDTLNLPQDVNLVVVDGRYEIAGLSEFERKVSEALEYIENHEFTEEDRKSLTGVRAAVNKYSSSVNESVKTYQSQMFGPVLEQKKSMQSKLDLITGALKSKIDEMDRLARQRKEEMFAERLQTESQYTKELESLDLYDLIDGSWLNRSASDKKNLEEFHKRLQSVVKLIEHQDCPSTDAREIGSFLSLYDWSELDAISAIKQKHAPIEETVKETTSLDTAKVVESADEMEVVSIKIKSNDFTRLIEALKSAEIQFQII